MPPAGRENFPSPEGWSAFGGHGLIEEDPISIDGMGGDHAPGIVVEGLERFAKRGRSSISCCMAMRRSRSAAGAMPGGGPRTTIRHADKFITMDDKPGTAIRRGKGSPRWGTPLRR